MFGYTMRSRLAGLANKPVLHSRVFSTAPVLREPIHLLRAIFGKPNIGPKIEFVTAEGLRNVTKFSQAHAMARAQASLKDKHAHNCYLSFTAKGPANRPILENHEWKAQMAAALKIVEHEQRLAVLRAGISALWLTVMHAPEDPHSVGIAFRLPKTEDPEIFEERLSTAGIVGGQLLVYSRGMDKWWETFAKGEDMKKFEQSPSV